MHAFKLSFKFLHIQCELKNKIMKSKETTKKKKLIKVAKKSFFFFLNFKELFSILICGMYVYICTYINNKKRQQKTKKKKQQQLNNRK